MTNIYFVLSIGLLAGSVLVHHWLGSAVPDRGGEGSLPNDCQREQHSARPAMPTVIQRNDGANSPGRCCRHFVAFLLITSEVVSCLITRFLLIFLPYKQPRPISLSGITFQRILEKTENLQLPF